MEGANFVDFFLRCVVSSWLFASSVMLGPQVEPMDGTTWHVKVFVPIGCA